MFDRSSQQDPMQKTKIELWLYQKGEIRWWSYRIWVFFVLAIIFHLILYSVLFLSHLWINKPKQIPQTIQVQLLPESALSTALPHLTKRKELILKPSAKPTLKKTKFKKPTLSNIKPKPPVKSVIPLQKITTPKSVLLRKKNIKTLKQPSKVQQRTPSVSSIRSQKQKKLLSKLQRRINQTRKKEALQTLTTKIKHLKGTSKPSAKTIPHLQDVLDSSVIDKIRALVSQCFAIPPSMPKKSFARLEALLSPSGTVLHVRILQYYPENAQGLALANSSERALLNPLCNPLPVPKNEYTVWRRLIFNFTPISIS